MKKILKKSILIMVILSMFMFVLSNNLRIFTSEFETMAESYRTTYTLYGDLNGDKKIDSFDIVMMRKKVLSKDTSKELDFNYDGEIDGSDLKLLSDYVLGRVSILDIYFYDDADEDGLCDLVEISLLKTNPDSSDTDGDTLSDFDEVVYTRTSPTDKYTNKLSITDADDDSDGDKLTNKEELSYKTNPLLSDSDFDGVNDYDELKKYKTDPNNEDSDNDNILDGDEVKLGLKPDTNKSNGTVLDNQRTFKQNIEKSSEILSYINADDSPYELSIDIVSAGVAEKELSVSFGEFSNCSEDEKIIGKSVALDYNDDLMIDSAKIYFSPRKIEDKLSDYMIFEFFPDNNYLLPVETKYTESSAYVETKDLGTYCLVNVKDIIETTNENSRLYSNDTQILSSENVSFFKDIVLDYELSETEVVFLVDISGALDSNIEETKNSIHDFSQALFEHTENGAVEIYGYYTDITTLQTQLIQYADSNKNTILSSVKSIDEALNGISSYTTNKKNPLISPISLVEGLLNENLFSSTCTNKYAFIISDSSYSFTDSYGFSLVVPKETCNSLKNIYDNNIHLNFILSEDSFKQTKAINNLKKECQLYDFGIYSKSKTGYFANDMYAKIYSDAIIDLKTKCITYTCSINPNKIPKKVQRNAFINSLPKSMDSSKVPSADADGNIDFKEAVDKTGIKFENLRSACDIFDLTRKGYEQLMKNQKMSVNLIMGAIQVTPFSDKILYADNDNDGIPNKDDPYPNEPFDDRFMLIDTYNYIPNINFVDNHIDRSDKCAYSKIPNPVDIAKFEMFCIFVNGGLTSALSFIHELSEWTEEYEIVSSVKFSQFLSWFLWDKGKQLSLTKDEMYSIIFGQKRNREHYSYNVNQLKNAVEEIVTSSNTSNNKIFISTKPESLFKTACYKGNCCYTHNGFWYDDATASDWGFSLGESLGAMTAEAYKVKDKYVMNVKYYIIDNYEYAVHWEEFGEPSGLDKWAHRLHEVGLANEFEVIGVYEDFITWEKDEIIYPDDYKEIRLDEDKYNSLPTS